MLDGICFTADFTAPFNRKFPVNVSAVLLCPFDFILIYIVGEEYIL